MEDNKGEITVIFAGYKKEMEDFINTNPGLRSRIAYNWDFPNYTEDDLLEIFKRKMDSYGYSTTQGAKEKTLAIIKNNKK